MLSIVISRINLVLCFANDILDLQLLEENKFFPKKEIFAPEETLKFVIDLFRPMANFQRSTVNYRALGLPEKLFGDQIRLKQILINLVKSRLAS